MAVAKKMAEHLVKELQDEQYALPPYFGREHRTEPVPPEPGGLVAEDVDPPSNSESSTFRNDVPLGPYSGGSAMGLIPLMVAQGVSKAWCKQILPARSC